MLEIFQGQTEKVVKGRRNSKEMTGVHIKERIRDNNNNIQNKPCLKEQVSNYKIMATNPIPKMKIPTKSTQIRTITDNTS